MTKSNRKHVSGSSEGYQVLFLVKATGLWAAYTSAKRPVNLGMARAYCAALERQGQPGRVVDLATGQVTEQWPEPQKEPVSGHSE